MAKTTSIDELYVSLGLDLNELDTDFIDAEKTVKQNIAKLKSESGRLRLKMDIDTAQLGPAANKTQVLEIRERTLTQQISLQKQVVALTNAEYRRSVVEKGASSAASQRLQTTLLREQRSLALLGSQLKSTNSGIPGAAAKVRDLGDSFVLLRTKMIGVMAFFAAGAGLFNVVRDATVAGDAIYQLSTKLHLSNAEAGEISRILSIGNVEAGTFASTMMRLDRMVMSVGANGNMATRALANFGIRLTDASGNLLPMNQQLARLAEGYQKASASGQEEAYVTQVLGSRGAELVGVLRQYTDLLEASSKVKTTGLINPDEAHRLAIDFKVLEMETTQLKTAFGAALMPIAKEIAPDIIKAMQNLVQVIRENKNEIVSTAEAVRELIGDVKDFYDSLPDAKKLYGENFGSLKQSAAEIRAFKEHPVATMASNVFWNKENNPFVDAAKSEMEAERLAREQSVAEHERSNKDKVKDTSQKTGEELKFIREAEKEKQALALETYKLTHSTIENELMDIRQKANEYRAKGADEESIVKFSEAAKSRVISEYMDSTVAKLNETYKTSLDNRLEAIEREKKAWRQKGIDEVSATKWAEEQKQEAIRNAAENAIKNDRKRLEQVRDAMKAVNGTMGTGIDKDGNPVAFNFQHKNALQDLARQWMAEDQEKMGIKPGETFTPELIRMYEQMKKYTAANLIPGLESGMPVPQMAALTPGGGKMYNVTGPITVNIDKPVVRDDADITALADQVADRMKPAIIEALGGGGNGY